MAHETHNDAHSERNKSIVSFKSSFWLAVILVGLFVAALNFINAMGEHKEGGHEGKAEATEMHEGKSEAKEAAKEGAKEAKPEAAKEGEASKEVKEETKPAATNSPAPEHK